MKTNPILTPRPVIRLGWSWLLALLLAAETTGCVIVPFPVPSKDTYSARTNLTSQSFSQFKPGQSSKEEVLLALGEPDAVSTDEHKLAYRSEKDVGAFVGVMLGPPILMPIGGDITKEWIYTYEFDAQGGLEKVLQTNGYSYPELPSPKWPYGDADYIPVWMSGERLWRIFPDTTAYAGVAGFQGLKTRLKNQGLGRIEWASAGWLILTESNLFLFSKSQFANAEPMLKLPLTSVTSVWIDERQGERMLVVSSKPDRVHSFVIPEPQAGIFSWGAAIKRPTRAACDYIQSKIKPTLTEP